MSWAKHKRKKDPNYIPGPAATPPIPPEILPDGRLLYGTAQLFKRIKNAMKLHPVLDGSGHLRLREKRRLKASEVTAVRNFVYAKLDEMNVAFEKKIVKHTVSKILFTIGLPRRGRGWDFKRKAKPQIQTAVDAALRPCTDQAHEPAQAHEAPRPDVQVTVRKKRSFHYPLDLQS